MAKYLLQLHLTLECYNHEIEVERPDGTDPDDIELTQREIGEIELEDWVNVAEDLEVEIDTANLQEPEKKEEIQ